MNMKEISPANREKLRKICELTGAEIKYSSYVGKFIRKYYDEEIKEHTLSYLLDEVLQRDDLDQLVGKPNDRRYV
jgi:hypothetical protein